MTGQVHSAVLTYSLIPQSPQNLTGNHPPPSQALPPYFLPVSTQEKVGQKGLVRTQAKLAGQQKLG